MLKCLLISCYVLAVIISCASLKERKIDPQLNWRILGGSDAPEGAYPHMISLQINSQHWCGGSIIHSEWVITAAHCIDGDSPTNFTILAGTNTWKSGGIYYPVIEIHIHENYTSSYGEHDVAVLKVKPITFTDKIHPISLETEFVGGDQSCTISGWGLTFYPATPSDLPNKLQHIHFLTDTNEHCQSVHGFLVPESDICTLAEKGQGTCFSDSGSPLIWNNGDTVKQIGMVIWMSGPCGNGEPNGYNRMSFYVEWIREKCKNCI